MDEEEVIEHASAIKDWCRHQAEVSCKDCVFCTDGWDQCMFLDRDPPEYWELPT